MELGVVLRATTHIIKEDSGNRTGNPTSQTLWFVKQLDSGDGPITVIHHSHLDLHS